MKKSIVIISSLIVFSNTYAIPFQQGNQPDIFNKNLTLNFHDLPTSASLSTPWSGDYWPTYKGGITYRWKRSCKFRSEEDRYAH